MCIIATGVTTPLQATCNVVIDNFPENTATQISFWCAADECGTQRHFSHYGFSLLLFQQFISSRNALSKGNVYIIYYLCLLLLQPEVKRVFAGCKRGNAQITVTLNTSVCISGAFGVWKISVSVAGLVSLLSLASIPEAAAVLCRKSFLKKSAVC